MDDKLKLLDYVKAGYSEEEREFYDIFRISNSLNKLFESEEYYQALHECFGDNPKMIKGFTFELFFADWLGRTGQFFTVYLSGKYLLSPWQI